MDIASDSEAFMEVQHGVLNDVYQKEHEDEDPVSFIIENAPLFRYFAEHLPLDLIPRWGDVTTNKEAFNVIEGRYQDYAKDIRRFIEQVDPELHDALIRSIEEKDVDGVARILESAAKLRRQGGDD